MSTTSTINTIDNTLSLLSTITDSLACHGRISGCQIQLLSVLDNLTTLIKCYDNKQLNEIYEIMIALTNDDDSCQMTVLVVTLELILTRLRTESRHESRDKSICYSNITCLDIRSIDVDYLVKIRSIN